MIKSWSYSRLLDFESCPLKAKLKHVDRIADPRPSPAADRGTQIHTLAEEYLLGKIKSLPPELKKFSAEFEVMKGCPQLDLEQEWGFDHDWQPTSWKTAWGRIKADAVAIFPDNEAAVVDFKTGKKFGNEVKHGEQLMLYALATFIMYPQIKTAHTELWYLDFDDLSDLTVSRDVAMKRYLRMFDKRARRMTEATEFPANPNIYSCKWCGFGEGEIKDGIEGTGHCKLRVTDKVATVNFFKRRNAK